MLPPLDCMTLSRVCGSEVVFEMGKIALQHRRDVGIDRCRAGAFVLAVFRDDLGGDGDREAGSTQFFRDELFMFGLKK